jgi:hypothetical protein
LNICNHRLGPATIGGRSGGINGKGVAFNFDELHERARIAKQLIECRRTTRPNFPLQSRARCHSNLAALDIEPRRRDASIVSRPSEPCFACHIATMNFDTVKLIFPAAPFDGSVTENPHRRRRIMSGTVWEPF